MHVSSTGIFLQIDDKVISQMTRMQKADYVCTSARAHTHTETHKYCKVNHETL